MPEPKLAEELEKMRQEPLLPIERKLIAWSILLGLFLVAVLAWTSHVLFRN
jgi:hypothetical protein